MTQINYVIGDATEPQFKEGETAIIVHICNDVGAWGAGFTGALSKKWRQPEKQYRSCFPFIRLGHPNSLKLGTGDFVKVKDFVFVYNLFGQRGIRHVVGKNPPIRYWAIREGLLGITKWHPKNCTFHMPRIGCGLAGGDWNIVEKIIQEELCDKGYTVTVYDLPKT